MSEKTQRQRYLDRHKALLSERSSWDTSWRSIENYILPYRTRFLSTDRNRGTRHNDKLINSKPMQSLRILSAGIQGGASSPTRPWFKLGVSDPRLNQRPSVARHFYEVEGILRDYLVRSNFYNSTHTAYTDLGGYGTAAVYMEDDAPRGLIRCYSLPLGQFCLATGPDQRVDSLYREVAMTVLSVVRRFGLDKVSRSVKSLYQQGDYEKVVEILHVVEPNFNYENGKLGVRGKPWRSAWMEKNAEDKAGLLEESGYYEFPVLTPRWEVLGEDTYGIGPGWMVLGDSKGLQFLERKKAKISDKFDDPATQGPSTVMGRRVSLVPGDHTAVDGLGPNGQITPIYVPQPHTIVSIGQEILRHEERIGSGFYSDLWLMMASADRREVTAREVAERHEEKMLQLGPVMERLQNEMLQPAIERAYGLASRAGVLPPPPPEIQGQGLYVVFDSIFTQAQKLLGAASIERMVGFVGSLQNADPNVVDVVNWDKASRRYSEALGAPPDILNDESEVEAIRVARAQQQQQQQQMEQMAQGARAAKDLSGAQMGGDNALSRLSRAFGGVA